MDFDFRKLLFAALVSRLVWGDPIKVTVFTDAVPAPQNSLRAAIQAATAGATIDCATIQGQTIPLAAPLPAITQSLTITTSTGSPVTISGGNNFQAFSIASGTVTLQNLILSQCLSKGGAGGDSTSGGGGGGAGGGGGLYVHNGTNVTLNNVAFSANQAVGGAGGAVAGGAGGGGGGGGYNGYVGSSTISNGGAGAASGGGGGGGGNTSGGSGGASTVAGTAGLNFSFGGGGGGGATAAGGASGGGLAGSASKAGGTSGGGLGGGGGGGIGAVGTNATTVAGGSGGTGIGSNSTFGGGGGGGGITTGAGGAGNGTGGGGGAGQTSGVGGAGGIDGGGGGGGNGAAGGNGGFGAGGGGGSSGGTSLFGGGTGGTGGGGGAGMGSAIFVQNGATVTIIDPFAPSSAIPVGGAGGGTGATGGNYGRDIFLRSGGTLVFSNTAQNITISTAIESDQGAGGGTGGGLTMSGSQTLILSGVNTYTGTVTISSGTLQIAADSGLGVAANSVSLGAATLQISAGASSGRAITLTGAGTFDTQGFNLTLSGIIGGSGSLTKIGSGALTLSGTNTYGGGSTINAGTVTISADAGLGNAAGALALGTATLQSTASFSSARTISLTGTGTFDTGGNTLTLSGGISGGGGLTKISGGTLVLTGALSYTGTTTLSAGTLQMNPIGLSGNIGDNGTLIFSQGNSGTYSGVLSGGGTLAIQGGGNLTLSGNSASFSGSTTVSAGTLTVNGSLAGSSITVASGGALSGSGTVGPVGVAAGGQLVPGSPLTVQGSLALNAAATTIFALAPTSGTQVAVSTTATLNGSALTLQPASGFYGISETYTLLTSGTLVGTFAAPTITNSNFTATLSYPNNTVVLLLRSIEPFLDFPFTTSNAASVGHNIDALNKQSLISLTSPLGLAIDALAGQSFAVINDALDQMHPATYSAFTEVQAEVGGQLLSIFRRRPSSCGCRASHRLWVEPFGNWLDVRDEGQEVGFGSNTHGVALGIDLDLLPNWEFGIGGAWNQREITWKQNRGSGSVEGMYGAFYTDCVVGNWSFGASAYAGWDTTDMARQIQYTTINEIARGRYHGLDAAAQVSAIYLFGGPAFALFPYANIDYLYLQQPALTEQGAPGLNLSIHNHVSQTLRTEAGFGLQWQDVNYDETICIGPQLALGWAMVSPLSRPPYRSEFVGESIPFDVVGWDRTWQLFTGKLGLGITYKCVSLSGDYVAELSVDEHTAFFGQQCNVRLDIRW